MKKSRACKKVPLFSILKKENMVLAKRSIGSGLAFSAFGKYEHATQGQQADCPGNRYEEQRKISSNWIFRRRSLIFLGRHTLIRIRGVAALNYFFCRNTKGKGGGCCKDVYKRQLVACKNEIFSFSKKPAPAITLLYSQIIYKIVPATSKKPLMVKTTME